MLIQFTVGNVLSFSEPVTFSMVGTTAVKEYENINSFMEPTHKLKLLKSAAIYGANASGKSNLIKAIQAMKNFVVHSFRDALIEENEVPFKAPKFLLRNKYDKKPSFFEIIFLYKNKRYRYGFEFSDGVIKSEWLFFVNTNKEIKLFIRDKQTFDVNKRSFKEGGGLEDKTRPNVLFLTVVAQLNGERSGNVLKWFKALGIVSGLNDFGYQNYTLVKYKNDEKFRKWAQSIIGALDIADLSIEKGAPVSFDNIKIDASQKDGKHIKTIFSTISKLEKNRESKKIVTWHHKYDDDYEVVEKIPFDFYTQESEGTKKIINFLGPVYDTLTKGHILFVDEMDSRLHSLLTLMIVKYFHEHNYNNAQLVFVSHDINLLKKEHFRRDQIWFTEKNEYGETNLYSLIEHKEVHVRKDAAFDKNYLNGKYGAIPFLEDVLTEFD